MSRRLIVATIACCSGLVAASTVQGCGGSGGQSFAGVSHVRITSQSLIGLTEEGQLQGPLDATLLLNINLVNGNMVFTVRKHDGTFTGVAKVLKYDTKGEIRHFEELGLVTSGSGAFAHIHSGILVFRTLDDRIHRQVTVTTSGKLSY